MNPISEKELVSLFSNIQNRKVVVLGDLMLDRYIEGVVNRISPEAPVPVVEVENEYVRLGGAANVAYNVRSLGANPIPIGVVGDDWAGNELVKLMTELGISTKSIIFDSNRPTILKTRIIANDQHVVRADWESRNPISKKLSSSIFAEVEKQLAGADAIIIEDYNKGLLTSALIKKVIQSALDKKIFVTVDPKFDNFFAYQKATVFKPNRKEVEAILGMHLDSEEKLQQACKLLATKLNARYILITLGEQGMCLYGENGSLKKIPTRARKVHDVSGAGDTVISTLTAALIAGFEITKAVTIANYAAGAVCAEVGVVPITPKMLKEAIAFFKYGINSKSDNKSK